MQSRLVFLLILSCCGLADSAEPGGQDPPVELGDWHCLGPLKEAAFGIARISFDTPFAPEQDVLSAGVGPIDLDKTYQTLTAPGPLAADRRWQRHPEWIDGYRHLLPRGPAPSRNESVLLYRTIQTRAEITLDAVYRSEDFVRLWLNGTPVAENLREKSVSVWPIPRPSSLCAFDPARPEESPRVIHDEPDGAIYDASLSYDARTIFFSAHRPGVEGDWHIYEIGVDGRGLRQLTLGPSANISPVLLPDGRIIFVSTRHGTYVQCQPATAGLLHVMDRDGGNVQRVSANIDSDQPRE